MNWIVAIFVFLLLLTYIAVELGWGGSGSDFDQNPPGKKPAFPHWRPWRPTGEPKPRDPDPEPTPKPKIPESVS